MSKIDLSKAKVGDKFRDRYGSLYELIYILKGDRIFSCLLVNEQKNNVYNYKVDGSYYNNDESNLDLVEQVLDEPLDELIQEATKQIKENDDAIAEENELQRREEVVELAEKMYIMFENETLRSYLSSNGSKIDCSEALMEKAIIRAASFINMKQKYLKEGKLC